MEPNHCEKGTQTVPYFRPHSELSVVSPADCKCCHGTPLPPSVPLSYHDPDCLLRLAVCATSCISETSKDQEVKQGGSCVYRSMLPVTGSGGEIVSAEDTFLGTPSTGTSTGTGVMKLSLETRAASAVARSFQEKHNNHSNLTRVSQATSAIASPPPADMSSDNHTASTESVCKQPFIGDTPSTHVSPIIVAGAGGELDMVGVDVDVVGMIAEKNFWRRKASSLEKELWKVCPALRQEMQQREIGELRAANSALKRRLEVLEGKVGKEEKEACDTTSDTGTPRVGASGCGGGGYGGSHIGGSGREEAEKELDICCHSEYEGCNHYDNVDSDGSKMSIIDQKQKPIHKKKKQKMEKSSCFFKSLCCCCS
jgi:hypothetical protein